MTHYLITYVGTPREMGRDEGRQHMVKYRDWLDNLGDAVVSAANPVRNTKTIDSEGKVSEGSASHMSGYTIIQAESDEAALAIAQACPYLEVGGQLEVSELVQLSS
ncbi:MAG: YciI family protein [Marinomonas sp.]|jgi:hypothetical protein|uniref:YciI family protein n=1 Tax=unclassified Marinomonas TaxID=196814 RepID=UPI0005FA7C6E|nr:MULTISPECIES: YciI family protein [unclassified Marinomonas]KJZ08845.1 hypothetical protein TW85_22635 [Marinomonas sp. S3726]KZM38766.1 hypothetical protein OA91_23430 [Marinomonas sp. SBI8L]KZM43770.1 hypothetical protein OA92_08870 [Marinomonas sp. SBI22]